MRPRRFFTIVALGVALGAAAIVSCSSFGGSDVPGGSGGGDSGLGVADVSSADDGAADASDLDSAPVSDLDSGLAVNLCTGGQGTSDIDDSFTASSKTWIEKSTGCSSAATYGSSGAILECMGSADNFHTLTTRDPLSAGAVAINISFVIDDTGTVPTHIFAQVLDAIGVGNNLSFIYDPNSDTVTAVRYANSSMLGAWKNVAPGVAHLLKIALPAANDGGISQGLLTMTLDDNVIAGGTVNRVAGPVQIGPYISAVGDAKNRYLAVRTWRCP